MAQSLGIRVGVRRTRKYSRYAVFWMRFEPSTSRMQVQSFYRHTKMLDRTLVTEDHTSLVIVFEIATWDTRCTSEIIGRVTLTSKEYVVKYKIDSSLPREMASVPPFPCSYPVMCTVCPSYS